MVCWPCVKKVINRQKLVILKNKCIFYLKNKSAFDMPYKIKSRTGTDFWCTPSHGMWYMNQYIKCFLLCEPVETVV